MIKWLLDLGDEEAAVERVKNTLARKIKIPGFGHRVYRTEDPRATHLRVLSEELGKRTGDEAIKELVVHRSSSVVEFAATPAAARRKQPEAPKDATISNDKGDSF